MRVWVERGSDALSFSATPAMNFDAEQYFDTPAAFLADRHLRPKKDVLKETPVSKKSISAAKVREGF